MSNNAARFGLIQLTIQSGQDDCLKYLLSYISAKYLELGNILHHFQPSMQCKCSVAEDLGVLDIYPYPDMLIHFQFALFPFILLCNKLLYHSSTTIDFLGNGNFLSNYEAYQFRPENQRWPNEITTNTTKRKFLLQSPNNVEKMPKLQKEAAVVTRPSPFQL